MNHRSRLTLTVLTLAAAGAFAPQAQASGFQLREQSPLSQGNAFAGISAGGGDISALFFNPAVMTQYDGTQFSLGGTYVGLSAKFENGSASRTPMLSGLGFNSSFLPISGSPNHGNAAISAVLPEFNIMYSVNKDLKLGLSLNVPFGLTTEYDANWIGRYHALKSDLKTIDIAPSIAYRFSPEWSGGVAFIARKADAELTNAVDYGTLLASSAASGFIQAGVTPPSTAANMALLIGATPGAYDGKGGLKGDGWGYGFKAGLVWEPNADLRIGLSHQSAMTMTLKGDATFEIPSNIPNVAPYFLANGLAAKGLKNGKGTAELNLPATTSLGFDWKATPAFSLQGEVARTTWSRFKELRIKFDTGLTDSITDENWNDTTFVSLGGTWKLDSEWTLRAGLAYDKSAVGDAHRTPRIPDNDRKWVALGASYAFSKKVSVDVGYSRLFISDGKVDLLSGSSPSDPNVFRGNLSGTIKAAINILGAQVRYSF